MSENTIISLMLVIVLSVLSYIYTGGFGSFYDIEGTKEVLKKHDLHPIKVGNYAWFSCGSREYYATKFKAYNSDSTKILEGCVCQGVFKGKVLKFY